MNEKFANLAVKDVKNDPVMKQTATDWWVLLIGYPNNTLKIFVKL
jgi:hypothetical protein